GYSRDSLKSVLRTPCRPYQQIIADALGVSPEEIWPSRYQVKSYMRKAS
ncbi:DNA-binding protein, partial [Escherichia coli]|nr:DNA-binding protein [Escherichia coli]